MNNTVFIVGTLRDTDATQGSQARPGPVQLFSGIAIPATTKWADGVFVSGVPDSSTYIANIFPLKQKKRLGRSQNFA